MPQLPVFQRFWTSQPWENLPAKTSPITAGALAFWDDWVGRLRDRVEEVASNLSALDTRLSRDKADKATKINPSSAFGLGLIGPNNTLGADISFGIIFGTASNTAARGDDSRIVNAIQKPSSGQTQAGDLLIGQANGTYDRLPKATGTIKVLGSSDTQQPAWVDPGTLGLGLPVSPYAGALLVGKADGSWTFVEIPDDDGLTLVTDADTTAPGGVSWVKNGNAGYAYEDRQIISSPTVFSVSGVATGSVNGTPAFPLYLLRNGKAITASSPSGTPPAVALTYNSSGYQAHFPANSTRSDWVSAGVVVGAGFRPAADKTATGPSNSSVFNYRPTPTGTVQSGRGGYFLELMVRPTGEILYRLGNSSAYSTEAYVEVGGGVFTFNTGGTNGLFNYNTP